MIYLCTKFKPSSCNGSLIIAIQPELQVHFCRATSSLFCVLEEYYFNKLHILCQLRCSTPALQVHSYAITPLTVQNDWVRHNVHIRFREKSVERFENINGISLVLTHTCTQQRDLRSIFLSLEGREVG
jgi:hypothetical protein